MLAHFGPNLQLPCTGCDTMDQYDGVQDSASSADEGGGGKRRRTLAKYLQIVSEAALRSWLKGHALPAWQAPCRKNLQGTCDVSGFKAKDSGQQETLQAQVVQGTDPVVAVIVCLPGQERETGTRRKLTWGASGSVKAGARHGTHHGGGSATLWRDIEASAAHMTMVARVGSCHRCGLGEELGCEFLWSVPQEGFRPARGGAASEGHKQTPRRPGHWSVRA
jgi:hypothetical protein